MSILPKAVCRFNAISIKISMTFFCQNRKTHPKIHSESQGTGIAKKSWKRRTDWRLTLSVLKLSYKATIIRTVCYWHKDRYTDQWNRTESPEIPPHMYDQMIFDKGANGERTVFSTNGARKTGYPHAKE